MSCGDRVLLGVRERRGTAARSRRRSSAPGGAGAACARAGRARPGCGRRRGTSAGRSGRRARRRGPSAPGRTRGRRAGGRARAAPTPAAGRPGTVKLGAQHGRAQLRVLLAGHHRVHGGDADVLARAGGDGARRSSRACARSRSARAARPARGCDRHPGGASATRCGAVRDEGIGRMTPYNAAAQESRAHPSGPGPRKMHHRAPPRRYPRHWPSAPRPARARRGAAARGRASARRRPRASRHPRSPVRRPCSGAAVRSVTAGEEHVREVEGRHRHAVARQLPGRRVLGQQPHPVAADEPVLERRALARRRRAAVVGDRARLVDGAPARRPGPPGDVDVLEVGEERRVEAADRLEHRAPVERDAAGRAEDVARRRRPSAAGAPASRSQATPRRSTSMPAELSTSGRSVKRTWAATEPTPASVSPAASRRVRQSGATSASLLTSAIHSPVVREPRATAGAKPVLTGSSSTRDGRVALADGARGLARRGVVDHEDLALDAARARPST